MITQYSNAYIGDVSINRMYHGSELLWVSGTPDILLEYIANGPDDTSTAQRNVYFDTDVNPTGLTTAEVKYQVVSTSSAQEMIFGVNYNNKYYHLLKDTYGNALFWYINRIGGVEAGVRPAGYADANIHTIRAQYTSSNLNISYDSSSYQGNKSSYTDPGTTAYLSIFARNKGTSHDLYAYGGMKIYYLKFWDNNNLIRFYIPVLHYINGQYTPCFYDKVNDTYIYNLGTDTPTYKISGDYLLDYLGSSPETIIPNTAQLDMRYESGVVASNQLQVDVKGRLVWGKENYLFGSGTSGQTTPSWQAFGYGTPGGSTDADKTRLRLSFGANETSNYTLYISSDASTVIGVNTLSMYFNTERGLYYLNGVSGITSSPVPNTFSSQTIHMFSRHGDASKINASAGSRIYYINFTNSNIPAKTFIPVLHNNQAAFLDLNSGTYIYNLGTAAPYYEFKR